MTDFDFDHAGKRPAVSAPSSRWQMLRWQCRIASSRNGAPAWTEVAFGLVIAGLFTLAFLVYPL